MAGFPSLGAIHVLGQIIPVVEAVLHLVEFLAASLASIHYMPKNTPHSSDNQSCFQTLPNVHWEVKSPLEENLSSMGTQIEVGFPVRRL